MSRRTGAPVPTDDPFDVAGIRERVLAGWVAAPVRFREDANAEDELARGAYRDRLVVELAQNAADAATRAGAPGRLLLRLAHAAGAPVLVAANTGAALSAAGVQALATLRASSKREGDSVGRFGVGFAAVLAVTDEPALLSRSGGVRFSASESARLVAGAAEGSPELAEELARRSGHVPVLRLPLTAQGSPPEGYDTAVVLPLHDEVTADAVARALDQVGDALLLALPALEEVVVDVGGDVRRLSDVGARWWIHRTGGQLDAAVLADRTVEERERPGYEVTWAVPRARTLDPAERVLHAPTPTDEPLGLPALLVATVALDAGRRRPVPGAATDAVLAEASRAYAEVVQDRAAAGDDVWPLVPVGLPAGEVDLHVREGALKALRRTDFLRDLEGEPVTPRDAVRLDVDVDLPAGLVAGLVRVPLRGRAAADALGVAVLGVDELVERIPTAREPSQWSSTYDALAPLAEDGRGREALALLPVPLADGRVVRGCRGVLVPSRLGVAAAGAAAALGLRIVHPQAAHPLLVRLGATPSGPFEVLVAGRAALEDASHDYGLALAADAVAAGLRPGELPWLADLELEDDRGQRAPAGSLALPGSLAADVLDPREVGVVSPELVQRWGSDVLRAFGVLDALSVERFADVDVADPGDELDDVADWATSTGADGVAPELSLVRDLDLVRPETWPRVLAWLGSSPDARAALLTPVLGQVSPTAWLLRREVRIDGVPLLGCGMGASSLLDPVPDPVRGVDPAVLAEAGVVPDVAGLVAAGGAGLLLDRLADDERDVSVAELVQACGALASVDSDDLDGDPPSRVRVVVPGGISTRVVGADEAEVVDDPRWWQLGVPGAPAVGVDAAALADVLGLPLSGEQRPGRVESRGSPSEVGDAVRDLLPEVPRQWLRHAPLVVDGVEVGWWVDAAGVPHAVDDPACVARALAWAAGRWDTRWLVAEVLRSPESVGGLLLEG